MRGPSSPEEVKLREYEVMLILPAEADESVVEAATHRISNVIEAGGGKVGKIDRWGKRRFAYEIADQTEGYYVVVGFTAEPDAQLELERVLNLADEVIRFKVLVVPAAKIAKSKKESEKVTSPASA
jgi:small subunit ribosomal protein S6